MKTRHVEKPAPKSASRRLVVMPESAGKFDLRVVEAPKAAAPAKK